MSLVKHFPLREIMIRNLLAINQCGLNDREFLYWYQAFATCYNQEGSFASVTIQDIHPTLQRLGFGYNSSFNILLLEMIYYEFMMMMMITEKRNEKNNQNFLNGFHFLKKLNLYIKSR